MRRLLLLALALLLLPAEASAATLPAETLEARKHFFGAQSVTADGSLARGRVILSWFSVGSFAAAIDGHVVLLDTYIHKGEDAPNYVPTTTRELIELQPEAIFIGHGHFDHAKNAGVIAERTGAVLVGTPEHCDQARTEASDPSAVRCVDAVSRDSAPGSAVNELRVLGDGVRIEALKHVHSATERPDGQHHETVLDDPQPLDSGSILLHPPGPSVIEGLNPAGDEGGTVLYRFEVGPFSLVWHDSSGPLRERGPHIFDLLRAFPPTDVQVGAVLGFNEIANGVRDPVDYIEALAPKLFVPEHHDFVSEYGMGRNFEQAVKDELAARGPVRTQFRWIGDPYDYLRPELLTFDVSDAAWADGAAVPREARQCVSRRARTWRQRSIGRLSVGRTRAWHARRIAARPVRIRPRSASWCVRGRSGAMTAVFATQRVSARATLVGTTSRAHRTRGVGPRSSLRLLKRRFPRARRVARGAWQAFPGSRRVFHVTRGRVRVLAVVSRGLLADRDALVADLREARGR